MALATQFDPAIKLTYDANVRDLCQQKTSAVAAILEQATMEGESKAFDQFEPFEFSQKLTKYSRTTPDAVEMKQRLVYANKYKTKKIYDNLDVMHTMNDINSDITRNMVYGVNRIWDTVALDAMLGSATIKANNASSTSTETLTSANYITGGGKGLTVAKLIQAKQFLDANDVPEDEQRYIILHPSVLDYFLNAAEVKDIDYNTQKALAMGELDTFMGFKFITTTLANYNRWGTLPSSGNSIDGQTFDGTDSALIDTTADYPCIVTTNKAGLFATRSAFESIVQREENYDYDWILYGETICGATRMDTDRMCVITADASGIATVS